MNARESKARIEKLEREVRALRKIIMQACIERDRFLALSKDIARDTRDTIWQPDWQELRARANGLLEWRFRFRREFERDNPEVYRDC